MIVSIIICSTLKPAVKFKAYLSLNPDACVESLPLHEGKCRQAMG